MRKHDTGGRGMGDSFEGFVIICVLRQWERRNKQQRNRQRKKNDIAEREHY